MVVFRHAFQIAIAMMLHAKIVSFIAKLSTDCIVKGCPCGTECPNGCTDNCSSRYCERSFLILNTALPKSTPLLMADSGEVNLKLNFQLGESTEVFRSCSVNFNGEMLIFGGNQLRQQVNGINSYTALPYHHVVV